MSFNNNIVSSCPSCLRGEIPYGIDKADKETGFS
jgi:hypothetical protein